MKTYELDPFLNWKMVKVGDHLKILDSGGIILAKDTSYNKDTFVIRAELPSKLTKPWRMNKESRDHCEALWGEDMEAWVNRWVKVTELRPVHMGGRDSKSIIVEPAEAPLAPQKLA